MQCEKSRTTPPGTNIECAESIEGEILFKFKDSVKWGCGIFSTIIVFFAGFLILLKKDMIIQFVSFFEFSNLSGSFTTLEQTYGITALVTILIAIFTGLYLYLRFFSNIRHNDFSEDMGKYLQFYETLYSTVFDLTILAILFLYLIFVKQSIWEFVIIFLAILGLGVSIGVISVPYSKLIRNYSTLERLNQYLNKIPLKTAREIFSDTESINDLIIFSFVRKKAVWTTGALFLTIIVAILGIAGEFNLLTLILLELMIIRYAMFQSQIGSLPAMTVTLFLTNNEIYNHVYIIRENSGLLLILTSQNKFLLIMKSQLKVVEPIIEQYSLQQS